MTGWVMLFLRAWWLLTYYTRTRLWTETAENVKVMRKYHDKTWRQLDQLLKVLWPLLPTPHPLPCHTHSRLSLNVGDFYLWCHGAVGRIFAHLYQPSTGQHLGSRLMNAQQCSFYAQTQQKWRKQADVCGGMGKTCRLREKNRVGCS